MSDTEFEPSFSLCLDILEKLFFFCDLSKEFEQIGKQHKSELIHLGQQIKYSLVKTFNKFKLNF